MNRYNANYVPLPYARYARMYLLVSFTTYTDYKLDLKKKKKKKKNNNNNKYCVPCGWASS